MAETILILDKMLLQPLLHAQRLLLIGHHHEHCGARAGDAGSQGAGQIRVLAHLGEA